MLTIILVILLGWLFCATKSLFEIRGEIRGKKHPAEKYKAKWHQWWQGFLPDASWATLTCGIIGAFASFWLWSIAPTVDVHVDTRELIAFPVQAGKDPKYVATCDWHETTIYGFYQDYGSNGYRYDYVTADGTARIVEGEGGAPVVTTYAEQIESSWMPWTLFSHPRSQFYEIRVPQGTISRQDCRDDAIVPEPEAPPAEEPQE